VFSEILDPTSCGGLPPCTGAYSSDIISALERAYTVAFQRNIVSVNMSLGAGLYSSACDTQPYKPAIDNLRAIGIATTVASGNSGSTTSISTPACVSSAVSVGSTGMTDVVSSFSNVAPFLSLFAPGESITSSIPGGGYAEESGTSMAAPHVAGSWALLKQAAPTASVTTILQALRQTGLPVVDSRSVGGATIPRVEVFKALASLVPVTNPAPTITSLSPTNVLGGSGAFTLTITGTGFDAYSIALWNGSPRPTTVVSTTQLAVSIPASDLALANGGSAQVAVSTPAPGGGTSSMLTFTIIPPPILSVSATSVTAGGNVTVTLVNGLGGSSDWLSLAATSAPSTSWIQYVYVGAGVTTRTWTVAMPTSGGPYEFRLMLNNSYTITARSPAISITEPLPVATSLSPAVALVGSAGFTLTVNGSGFVPSSVVLWNGANRPTTYVSASQLQATIGAGDVAAVGTVSVSVFSPAPGGGTSATLPFTISPVPTLSVSATSVAPGSNVTVTLVNGLGGSSDWISLAATSASNTSWIQYVYVGAGVTTRTWTVAMPTSGGPYEFRLMLNNSYTITARSPAISIIGP